MSTDNRTIINDCEANTGWSGDDSASTNTDAGSFYQGSTALSTQLSNADEQMSTTEDSIAGDVFSLDWSDSTLYMLVKDNLQSAFAAGGMQFVVGDAADLIGYFVGGNDARGLALPTYYTSFKLDVSVVVAAPGVVDVDFTEFAGDEPSLDQTLATQIGYGTIHQAKAVGAVDNVFMDAFRHIANGSYALSVTDGTSGTPETMADVVADDITNGWGMISNPLGLQYLFFAPTEWTGVAGTDHYFEATGEQWFWIGDNAGGLAVGITHFPFRVASEASLSPQVGSWKINNVVIVNTGTSAEFLCDDEEILVLEIDGCSMSGLASFGAPSLGGDSRFCTNTIFSGCGQITHNGASMNGCSVLLSKVAANGAAMFYNETVNPDGEMDDLTFTQGTFAHHAITFGTATPITITLRNMDFTGFSSSNDNDGSIFRFDNTTDAITLNLVGCSHDGSGFTVDDRAGSTVTIVIDPRTATFVCLDGSTTPPSAIENVRVLIEAADGAGDLPFEDVVTLTQTGGTVTAAHTAHGMVDGDLVIIRNAVETEYNGTFPITNSTTNDYDYIIQGNPSSPATGTIIASGAVVFGLTDSNGEIADARTWSSSQVIKGTGRKKTSEPVYETGNFTGTISNAADTTLTSVMQPD